MSVLRKLVAVAAATVVLGTACRGGGSPENLPSPTGTGSVEMDSNRTEASVTVRVRGAESIDFAQTATIIIFRTLDERVPLGFRLFSVGLPEPVELTPGVSFRTAFDVLGFKGDGRYAIGRTTTTPQGPGGVDLPSGIQSNAFLEIYRPAEDPPLLRYDVALEPCEVEAGDQARVGSLDCPKLRATGEAFISLFMSWEA